MSARPTWKGFLKVSLVNIPIKVFPAAESSGTLSFNQLHGECRTRIQQKRWCPQCNREVGNSEIVKGYEFEKGRWVVLTDEDFAKVRPESTRVIDLVQFAEIVSDLALVEPHGDLALHRVDFGTHRPSFPVLRKRANCITAGTSRRAICTIPPGRKLHLRRGPNAEAVKAHRVDPRWTKAALLLLVSFARLAP